MCACVTHTGGGIKGEKWAELHQVGSDRNQFESVAQWIRSVATVLC